MYDETDFGFGSPNFSQIFFLYFSPTNLEFLLFQVSGHRVKSNALTITPAGHTHSAESNTAKQSALQCSDKHIKEQ